MSVSINKITGDLSLNQLNNQESAQQVRADKVESNHQRDEFVLMQATDRLFADKYSINKDTYFPPRPEAKTTDGCGGDVPECGIWCSWD